MLTFIVISRQSNRQASLYSSYWRRILALRRFHYMADGKHAAITVQAAFRGFLARVRVKEYLKKMDFYVCLTQARLRRRLVTKRWNISLDIMQSSAIFIQRNIRKFLAKCSLQNCAIDNAAIMIQMGYRRSVLRKKCYCRKRCNAAVKIQRVVRRIQARQKVNLFRKELNEASRNIQRCWRGYKARKMRNEVLLHRCLTEFRNRIKVLDSKIDCFENQLEKFLTKSHPGKVQSDFDRSQQNINRMKTQVESHERSIVELEWSKSLMNPNENDIDWGEEIDERIFQERQMKTSLQLDLMFNMKRNLCAYRRE
jgi:IQ calmodulin-binding motif.